MSPRVLFRNRDDPDIPVAEVDPVDATRLIYGGTWEGKVGVEGGIPTNYTQSGSEVTLGANAATNLTNINNALSGAADDTYVLLPSGTYDVGGTINLANSRTILRGAVDGNGAPATVLNFTAGSEGLIKVQATSWDLSSAGAFTRINISSGATRGSSTVTLASTPTTLAVDQIMFISATGPVGDGFYDLYQTDAFVQVVRVTAKNGNDVSFEPALSSDYLTGTIRVGWRAASTSLFRSGVENVSLTRGGTSTGHYFKFQGTDECWLKNVHTNSVPSSTYHVYLYGGFRTEIRHSEFEHMTDLTNSTYCIFADYVSGALIEDNYFHDAPNILVIVGLNCSAITYNYITDLPYTPNSQLSQIVFQHGGHSHYILFEGNWLATSYHDGSNNGFGTFRNFVYLRNRMRGYDDTGTKDANTKCITIMDGNVGLSMAGNVLGENGHHTLVNGTFSDTDDSDSNHRIYSIHTGVTDTEKLGNYNTVDDAVPAGEALAADEAIVTSYRYASKPGFFSSLPWPPITPSDFTQSNNPENIPAGYRAINGVDP